MPWCEDCNKYLAPPTLSAEGACPTCSRVIVKARPKVPWHFKVLLVGTSIYLVYRIYWFAEWLPHHL